MKHSPLTKENIDLLWALMDEYASAHAFLERTFTTQDHDWASRRMVLAKIGALHLLTGEPNISKECLASLEFENTSTKSNFNPDIPPHILEGLL